MPKKENKRKPNAMAGMRLNADSSYTIKKIIDAVSNIKGMEFVSTSGTLKNGRRKKDEDAFLRSYTTFIDHEEEKRLNRIAEKRKRNKKRDQ